MTIQILGPRKSGKSVVLFLVAKYLQTIGYNVLLPPDIQTLDDNQKNHVMRQLTDSEACQTITMLEHTTEI
jgi:predicted AAA+ superfamily ATPase